MQPAAVSVIISKMNGFFGCQRRLAACTTLTSSLICLMIVGLSSASSASIATTSTAASKTRVVVFQPFVSTGLRPGVVVAARANGHCWTGSISDSEAYAWRCMRGDSIYDPCFSSRYQAKPGYVVCPLYKKGSAEPSRVLRMTLRSSLPSEGDAPRKGLKGRWWLIGLHNGVECQTTDGAASYVRGVPAVYYCDGGGIAGEPKQSGEPWTVRDLQKGSSSATTQIIVSVSDG